VHVVGVGYVGESRGRLLDEEVPREQALALEGASWAVVDRGF